MSQDKIKVKTGDGDTVEVDLNIAKRWEPVKGIIEVLGLSETQENPIDLENISTRTLNKIIEWSEQHKGDSWDTDKNEAPGRRYTRLTSWDENFYKIPQEQIFEIILGANYLGITLLLDMGCKTVADMMRNKTPAEIRETFNLPNDLPPPKELPPIKSEASQ